MSESGEDRRRSSPDVVVDAFSLPATWAFLQDGIEVMVRVQECGAYACSPQPLSSP